jgi:formylmethanofuran dehydrogenase subunit E
MQMDKMVGCTLSEYYSAIESFHGSLAPGMVLGWFMVDLAKKSLPSGTLFDALSETSHCLPDAIQILTSCSVGNRWLRVIDVGRFALTFFEKDTGLGARVHVDTLRLASWPRIEEWFLKLRPKALQDRDRLLQDLLEAGTGILVSQEVAVAPGFLRRKAHQDVRTCRVCNELYRADNGPVCPACLDQSFPVLFSEPISLVGGLHEPKAEFEEVPQLDQVIIRPPSGFAPPTT